MNMIAVSCDEEGCSRTFGVPYNYVSDGKSVYCREHKKEENPYSRGTDSEPPTVGVRGVQRAFQKINTTITIGPNDDSRSVADILEEGSETFETKEEDYGQSWKLAGKMLNMMSGDETVELETDEDFIRFGLFTRRLDKVVRAFQGEFCSEEMNHESVQDSLEDEMVYAAMHSSTHE